MKIRRLSVGVLGLVLTLSGCVQLGPPTPQPPSTPTPPSSQAPVVRPTIDDDFVSRIDGDAAVLPLATAALRLLRGTDAGLQFGIPFSAYHSLIAGDKDLILVAAPNQDVMDAAARAGVTLEVIPIAKDALVFLTNQANPVTNLTQKQVKEIYTGAVTNWKQLGGTNAPILAYQQPEVSNPQTFFLQLAMGDAPLMDAPHELRPDPQGRLEDAVSVYDGAQDAIGYSMSHDVQQMYGKDNVHLISIDGVSPTGEAISDQSYPYQAYYYAVVRTTEPENSTSRQLIDWLLTWEGQQTASGTGYVPFDPSTIIPMRDEYGYAGSTQENTSQSSGTGGDAGERPSALYMSCGIDVEPGCGIIADSDTGTVTDVIIPGYPQAEEAIKAWATSLSPSPTYANSSCTPDSTDRCESFVYWFEEMSQDLIQAGRVTSWDGMSRITSESGLFRASDGHQLSLSDLFYDGVNYIDFINTNLLNTETNQALADCALTMAYSCRVGDMKGPFTGLPADYTDFELGQGQLIVHLPHDNPFLSTSDWRNQQPVDSYVSINLPADLSPYGVIWRYDRVTVGHTLVPHLVRDYSGADPVDAVINQALDDFAAQNPGVTGFTISAYYDSVTVCPVTDSGYGELMQFDYSTGEQF